MKLSNSLAAFAILSLAACGSDGGDGDNEEEVITTVTLTFTPSGGGDAVTAAFDDPDGDGGDAPTIDDIELTAGDYDLTVTFTNKLEDPPEDVTEEIDDESDEHQLFFTGTAVDGPASDQPGAPLTQAYADQDLDGLPIGLDNTITAIAGNGEMTVTLRHLPPVNDEIVKTGDLATTVRDSGFGSIGGSSDVQVDFTVRVQ